MTGDEDATNLDCTKLSIGQKRWRWIWGDEVAYTSTTRQRAACEGPQARRQTVTDPLDPLAPSPLNPKVTFPAYERQRSLPSGRPTAMKDATNSRRITLQIEDVIVARIRELLETGDGLRQGNEYGQVEDRRVAETCRGWLVAATNVVQVAVSDPNSVYRTSVEQIAGRDRGFTINEAVGDVCEILENLLKDADSGLLSSVGDHARAEVFDDFLDHAKAYMREDHKNEAGVISGVVFEDSLRRACRKLNIQEQETKLDELISQLAKGNVLTATKAKRARVCAHVRTKATHAQWDEFDEADVKTTIEFTEEFIQTHVET